MHTEITDRHDKNMNDDIIMPQRFAVLRFEEEIPISKTF